MKILKKIISMVLSVVLLTGIISPNIEAEIISGQQSKIGSFPLSLTVDTTGFGSVNLDWSSYNYANKNFKVFKSTNNGATYESVGIDYKSVKEVKVLNIYPDTGSELKSWMDAYGKGIIKVTQVAISDFNKNPSSYLYIDSTTQRWNYNVIFFGSWDRNNYRDLSSTSKDVVDRFIRAGNGAVFGHDTFLNHSIEYTDIYEYTGGPVKNGQNNFDALARQWFPIIDYVSSAHTGGESVQITKKGLFTTYPWYIGEIGTNLNIPYCHSWGQTIKSGYDSNIWLKFNDASFTDPTNYYMATYNNVASIQTGHSKGAATEDEQKILANLIFYLNQLLFNEHTFKDTSAQDVAAPNLPTVTQNVDTIKFAENGDNGSHYKFYVEAYSKEDTTSTGLLDRSETESLDVVTGVKRFKYIFDNNSNTIINGANLENASTANGTTASIPTNFNYSYLHVVAVDGAGNFSETKTIPIQKTYNQTVNVRYQNADGSWGNYSPVINQNYDQGQTVSWSRPADATYKEANVSFVVNGAVIKYVDVYRQQYTVTLNKTTGIESVSGAGTYYAGQACTINATPSTGYRWKNWTGSSTFTSQSNTFTITGNVTYTANTDINSSTLVINPNGGIWNSSTSKQNFTGNYNTTKYIPVPTKTGYTFSGWTRTNTYGIMSSLTGNATYTFGPTNNVTDTLTATWKINQYNVTYIDVVNSISGKELGRTTKQINYNSAVRGSDLGSDTGDNAYHNGYYYVSDTSATVTTSGATVYRIFKLRTIDKTITTVWKDNNNSYNTRPSNISYTLLQNGSTYQTGTITSSSGWQITIQNLPKYDENGKEYIYTVTTTPVIITGGDTYQPSYNGMTIINTLTGVVNPDITKTWYDNNNSYNTRPSSISYTIKRNGSNYTTGTITATNGWATTVSGLPKYDSNGSLYTYTVEETKITLSNGDNYNASYNRFNIINTITGKTSVTISKVWKDNNNAYNTRPSNISYTLQQNGKTYKTGTLTSSNSWKTTISDLPKYDENGVKYSYTVIENNISVNGSDSYVPDYNGLTITNTLTGNKNLNITKVWDDQNNIHNTRPSSLKITILQNGIDYKTVTLSASNSIAGDSNKWRISVNVPKYDNNGVAYTYTIMEDTSNINIKYFYETAIYNQSTLTVTNTAKFIPTESNEHSEYKIIIHKDIVNEDGNAANANDFRKIALNINETYNFAITLKELNRTVTNTGTSLVESYNGYSGNVFTGIVTNKGDLIFNLGDNGYGKYEISESANMYFNFVDITKLNDILNTEGAFFSKENGKYYITISGITGKYEQISIKVTNQIKSDRCSNEVQIKKNLFKID